MNRLNYAFAMLTAAGGGMAMSTTAHAVTLYGSFTNSGTGYSETFQLQSDGGVPDATPDYTDFALTNDSLGNTVATVGDNTTGFKATTSGLDIDSYFGTGLAGSGPFSNQTFDSFKPAFYDSSESPGVLQAGVYLGDVSFDGSDATRSLTSDLAPLDFDGSVVVLSTGGVPEPDAWALLIAGAAMVGGARRAARKRVLVQA